MAETKIIVADHGSLKVEGEFTIYDQNGKAFNLAGRTKISLCRCGQSNNKPFCDGNHRRIEFQSEIQARELPPPAAPKPSQG